MLTNYEWKQILDKPYVYAGDFKSYVRRNFDPQYGKNKENSNKYQLIFHARLLEDFTEVVHRKIVVLAEDLDEANSIGKWYIDNKHELVYENDSYEDDYENSYFMEDIDWESLSLFEEDTMMVN